MRSEFRKIAAFLLAGLIAGADPGGIAAQQPTPYRLTLQDAIQKALQANLNVLVAGTRVDEAEAHAHAPLVGRVAAARERADLRQLAEPRSARLRYLAPGLPVPSVVGPFSNYDFRVYAQQNVIDLAKLSRIEGQRIRRRCRQDG